MLACVFGAERFHTHVFGKHFTIESDHKPLEVISKKNLTAAPARLQRMLLRLQRYDFTITYRPGKEMVLADSLSRLPSNADNSEINLDVKVCLIQFSMPRLNELRNETRDDPVLHELMEYVISGFPEHRRHMSPETRLFWSFRDEITMDNGILMKGKTSNHSCKIEAIISERYPCRTPRHYSMSTTSQVISLLAKTWIGTSNSTYNIVINVNVIKHHSQLKNSYPSLMNCPNIAWHTLGTDLFTLNGEHFIIIADYMSKYPIIEHLGHDTTSYAVAKITSKYISLFGAPHSIISDNGPQFIGKPYKQLMSSFKHLSCDQLSTSFSLTRIH